MIFVDLPSSKHLKDALVQKELDAEGYMPVLCDQLLRHEFDVYPQIVCSLLIALFKRGGFAAERLHPLIQMHLGIDRLLVKRDMPRALRNERVALCPRVYPMRKVT